MLICVRHFSLRLALRSQSLCDYLACISQFTHWEHMRQGPSPWGWCWARNDFSQSKGQPWGLGRCQQTWNPPEGLRRCQQTWDPPGPEGPGQLAVAAEREVGHVCTVSLFWMSWFLSTHFCLSIAGLLNPSSLRDGCFLPTPSGPLTLALCVGSTWIFLDLKITFRTNFLWIHFFSFRQVLSNEVHCLKPYF